MKKQYIWKICPRCKYLTKVGKNEDVCDKCLLAEKAQTAKARWSEIKRNKLKKRGLSFEFAGGKWYWQLPNGLTNGPFNTIHEAYEDAEEAEFGGDNFPAE